MSKIELLKVKIGMWLAFGSNKTMTATSKMLLEKSKNIRCIHCGKNPISKSP